MAQEPSIYNVFHFWNHYINGDAWKYKLTFRPQKLDKKICYICKANIKKFLKGLGHRIGGGGQWLENPQTLCYAIYN